MTVTRKKMLLVQFSTSAKSIFLRLQRRLFSKSKWTKPIPIQAQGLPITMSVHDVVGIAQTASSLLPALAHTKAQPPV